MFSLNEIKFLITLHHLKKEGESSKNKDFALKMNISKTAVSKVTKPLVRNDIIKKESDGNICFTTNGKYVSKDYLERYDSLFYYFTQYLKLNKTAAHIDSLFCTLTISEESTSKISEVCHYNCNSDT